MFFRSQKARLDFQVPEGIASGYRVIYPERSLLDHQQEYGRLRPELYDKDFIDIETVLTIKSPLYTFQALKKDGSLEPKKDIYIFFRPIDPPIIISGKEYIKYTKVIVEKKKDILIIKTTFIATTIKELEKCQPITKL